MLTDEMLVLAKRLGALAADARAQGVEVLLRIDTSAEKPIFEFVVVGGAPQGAIAPDASELSGTSKFIRRQDARERRGPDGAPVGV